MHKLTIDHGVQLKFKLEAAQADIKKRRSKPAFSQLHYNL